jgi:hypothetical protein
MKQSANPFFWTDKTMTSRHQATTSFYVTHTFRTRMSLLEFTAFCGLIMAIAYTCIWLAPASPFLSPGIPPHFSMMSCVLFSIVYSGLRLMPQRKLNFERLSLTLFLGGMPIIYIWSALLHGHALGVFIEILGAFIFMGMAAWGFRRPSQPWILALGIAGHGLAWDSWHHNHSAYMENWYSLGCLLIDVALAFLVVTQFDAYRRAGELREYQVKCDDQ